jgi:protein phosphatase
VSSLLVTPPGRSPAPPGVRPRSPGLQAFGLTHPGLVRAVNEDAYLVDAGLGLFAVADGVGGHAGGEIASRLALDALRTGLGDPSLPGAAGLRLVAAVEHANARVHAAAGADRAWAGMATTLTAMLVQGNAAAIAHVGDTRAYRLRGRRLDQLTEDHTLVAAYVQAGTMTAEEAAVSRLRNVILRAVGSDEVVEVDTSLVAVEPGDTFLLCSDGLHGVVGDGEIAEVILAEPDLTAAATELVERANDGGGPDNVTVVLARIG